LVEGLCVYRVPDACMSTLVGFMVGVRVVFGAIVCPVFRAHVPVITELVLESAATEPPEVHIHHFGPAGTIIVLVTPVAVKLSV
jgi:hypothetical protein